MDTALNNTWLRHCLDEIYFSGFHFGVDKIPVFRTDPNEVFSRRAFITKVFSAIDPSDDPAAVKESEIDCPAKTGRSEQVDYCFVRRCRRYPGTLAKANHGGEQEEGKHCFFHGTLIFSC